jgi:hypothetical protein
VRDRACPDCGAAVIDADVVTLTTGAAGYASSGANVAKKVLNHTLK